MEEREFKSRLRSEMTDFSFTTLKKKQISNQLKVSLIRQETKTVNSLHARIISFWHGTTEIPIYLGVAALVVLFLCAGIIVNTFAVDKTDARIMLQESVANQQIEGGDTL